MAEIITRLPLIADQIDAEIEQQLTTIGVGVLLQIQALAPVDTGALRASYSIEKVDETTLLIGSRPETHLRPDGRPVDYAIHQEFGTKLQSGTPHLRPGFEHGAKAVEEGVAASIKKFFS